MKREVDVLGIGFGPANISMAAALQETRPDLSFAFIEKNQEIIWQKDMLFNNALDLHSNIQNVPYRDLATPRDPRSKYTFLNYLFEKKRLFTHLNMDLMLPLRPEYADYIKWVAGHFADRLQTGVAAEKIAFDKDAHTFDVALSDGSRIVAKNIVLGTGRPVNVPAVFQPVLSEKIFHFINFKTKIEALVKRGAKKIAVIGSSQSAAEIILYASKVFPELTIHGIMRRFAFPLKDTNPFMSEIYFPEFSEKFFDASSDVKARINRDVVRTNYGAADMDVIEEIYKQIYHDKLFGRNMIELFCLTDIDAATETADGTVALTLTNHLKTTTEVQEYDGVILATGFKNIGPQKNDIKIPAILEGIADLFALDEHGVVSVNRNYKIALNVDTGARVFLNGLCESTHGMGDAGSLSLVSIRAQKILSEVPTRSSASVSESLAASPVHDMVEV